MMMRTLKATHPSSEDQEAVPRGLVFFPPGIDPRKKRRRLLFVAFYFVSAAALVWPIYPLFSGIHPMVLGLPQSLAWIILVLGAAFAALLALYLTEDDGGETA